MGSFSLVRLPSEQSKAKSVATLLILPLCLSLSATKHTYGLGHRDLETKATDRVVGLG